MGNCIPFLKFGLIRRSRDPCFPELKLDQIDSPWIPSSSFKNYDQIGGSWVPAFCFENWSSKCHRLWQHKSSDNGLWWSFGQQCYWIEADLEFQNWRWKSRFVINPTQPDFSVSTSHVFIYFPWKIFIWSGVRLKKFFDETWEKKHLRWSPRKCKFHIHETDAKTKIWSFWNWIQAVWGPSILLQLQ